MKFRVKMSTMEFTDKDVIVDEDDNEYKLVPVVNDLMNQPVTVEFLRKVIENIIGGDYSTIVTKLAEEEL